MDTKHHSLRNIVMASIHAVTDRAAERIHWARGKSGPKVHFSYTQHILAGPPYLAKTSPGPGQFTPPSRRPWSPNIYFIVYAVMCVVGCTEYKEKKKKNRLEERTKSWLQICLRKMLKNLSESVQQYGTRKMQNIWKVKITRNEFLGDLSNCNYINYMSNFRILIFSA